MGERNRRLNHDPALCQALVLSQYSRFHRTVLLSGSNNFASHRLHLYKIIKCVQRCRLVSITMGIDSGSVSARRPDSAAIIPLVFLVVTNY